MIRKAIIAITLSLWATLANAQSTEPYSVYLLALPSATSVSSPDFIYLNQSGVSKKASIGQIPEIVGTTQIINGVANGVLFSSSGTLQNNGPIVSAVSNPTANGQWSIGATSTLGVVTIGQGSVDDWCAENSAGTCVIVVPTGTVRASLAGAIQSVVRSSSSATVTASASTDYFFCLDPTSNAIAFNLPPTPPTGLTYLVKDCTGHAATHSITITPNSGNIDGAGTFVISTNFQSIGLTYTGAQWSVN